MARSAAGALMNAMMVYNALLIPMFVGGVLTYLRSRGTPIGTAGLVLAAASPFIALGLILILVKIGVIKPPGSTGSA